MEHAMWWQPSTEPALSEPSSLIAAARRCRESCTVIRRDDGGVAVGFAGSPYLTTTATQWVGQLPPLFPEHLGDRSFLEAHGVRFPYVVGEMANGIATARMVIAARRAGLLGFFGAAGLPVARIEAAIDEIRQALGADDQSWGSNLIHSPHEPDLEMGAVELYLRRGVTRVSASAYMDLTPMIVRYAATGLHASSDGRIHRRNFVFAKISRVEVARRFLQPMPKTMLDDLVRAGHLSLAEAQLAAQVGVASDMTVEADSGGHTDNQALPCVFPAVKGLVHELAKQPQPTNPVRVGAAGGLGTPDAVASAFALGAAYVLTGSINQSAVESGLSEGGRNLLAGVRLGDVTMAPAADMFEMGVKVQVLKKGSLFAQRAHRLYDVYKSYDSIDAIPKDVRAVLEKDIFRQSLEEMWRATHDFFTKRDPSQLTKAEASPKHKMALVFRAYLGQASKWAIAGQQDRALDFQIWCGPAMGSFNSWVEGSFLAAPSARTVEQIALNLLEGAAVVTRAQQLRVLGAPMPPDAFLFSPRPLQVQS
jgi:trans-AT polyketide synthase, acyltransferase and oxidoreductase domains